MRIFEYRFFLMVMALILVCPVEVEAAKRVKAADHVQQWQGEGCSLSIPPGWALEEDDGLITLESPLRPFVMISILDMSIAPAFALMSPIEMAKEFLQLGPLEIGNASGFDSWGNLSGMGLHHRGRLDGSIPGGIRTFAANTGGRTIVVTEVYSDTELPATTDGFLQIAKSFALR